MHGSAVGPCRGVRKIDLLELSVHYGGEKLYKHDIYGNHAKKLPGTFNKEECDLRPARGIDQPPVYDGH